VTAVGHGIARVYCEVDEHLLELAGVGEHRIELRLERRPEFDVRADQPGQHRHQPVHDVVEEQRLRLEHLLAAECEELPGEMRRSRRCARDLL
jgi:hypothetical protein